MQSRFLRVTFAEVIDGGRPSLAPNGCTLAYVTKGTQVVFLAVTGVLYAERSGDAQQLADRPRRIGQYSALDEVTDLCWSPDSTMIAVWMEMRRSIEVVSANTLAIVARIDGGLNGLRQLEWHPSSRCLYWFGLAQSHAVDLTDGSTMVFEDPVKIVAPQGYSSWVMTNRGRMLTVPAVAHDSSERRRVLCSSALIAVSNDSQYVFTVSPCQVHTTSSEKARLRSSIAPNSLDPSDAAKWQQEVAAEVLRINEAAADDTLPVAVEKLHVYCAITHEELATIALHWPAPKSAEASAANVVTDFRVTSSCIVLFDQPAMRVMILSLDGERLLGDFDHIVAFSSTPDGGAVLLLDVSTSRLIVLSSVYGRLYRTGDIPLLPEFFPVAVQVLTETAIEAAAQSPFRGSHFDEEGENDALADSMPRATYTVSNGDDALMSWGAFTATEIARRPSNTIFAQAFEAVQQRRSSAAATSRATTELDSPSLDPALAACASVACIRCSPCGRYAAVVAPHLPTTLLVVDIVQEAQVRAVMRHYAPVDAVQWRPAVPSWPAALAFTTDSHSGNVFIWTAECAMCLSAPLHPATRSQKASSNGNAMLTGFSRLSWGANGTTLLLVDDLQQRFTTCELHQ